MQAVKRVPVTEQVVDSLKEYITSGNVSVGDKMPTEMELCAMLNVGRGTVREATRVLQTMGYVEIQHGKGAFIARTSEPDKDSLSGWFAENEMELMDYMQVRMAVEPLAARLAIEHCSPADITALQAIQRETEQAVRRQDAATLAVCDEKFHARIFDCSGNKLLKSIGVIMLEALKVFRGRTFFIPENAQNVLEPHASILRAFENGDAPEGERCMRDHITYIVRDLEKSISAGQQK